MSGEFDERAEADTPRSETAGDSMDRWDAMVEAQHQENMAALEADAARLRESGDVEGAQQTDDAINRARAEFEGSDRSDEGPPESAERDSPMDKWDTMVEAQHEDNMAALEADATRLRESGDLEAAQQTEAAIAEARAQYEGSDRPDEGASEAAEVESPMDRWDEMVDAQHEENIAALEADAARLRAQGDLRGAENAEAAIRYARTPGAGRRRG